MAKTNFESGTIVLDTFLDTIYHTNGGHLHNGGTEDGNAPLIDGTQITHAIKMQMQTYGLEVLCNQNYTVGVFAGYTTCYNTLWFPTASKIGYVATNENYQIINNSGDHWLYEDESGIVIRGIESADTDFLLKTLNIYCVVNSSGTTLIRAATTYAQILALYPYARQIGCVFIRHIGVGNPHIIHQNTIENGTYYFKNLYGYADYLNSGQEATSITGGAELTLNTPFIDANMGNPLFGTLNFHINDTGTLGVITVKRSGIIIKQTIAKELEYESFFISDIGYQIQVNSTKDCFMDFSVEGFRKFWQ